MLFLILLLTGSAVAVAQQLGRLTYLEGTVELLRDNSVLDSSALQIGTPVLELDVIQTGPDGYAEIEMTRPAGSLVRISDNSAYYVELIPGDGGGEQVRLKLLSGTVSLAVERVSRTSRLEVRTQTAAFGVRGTEFDVLTAPDESTLLGVREGQVSVATERTQIVAVAGSAVETETGGEPQESTVPDGDFDAYYARWQEIRLQVFRNGAPTFVQAYGRRYLDTVDSFQRAYTNLVAFRPQLQEAAAREGSSLGEDMRLRQQVSPAIVTMRSVLPFFENTVYRLRELRRFHNEGYGRTQINGQSSERFFRDFATAEGRHLSQLAEVRAIFRLYGQIEQRSFGGLPGGDSPFGGNPFGGNGQDLLESMRF